MPSALFKITVLLAWMVLMVLLLQRELFVPMLSTPEAALIKTARETSFYGIWLHGRRIGYVEEQLEPMHGGYRLKQEARMELTMLGGKQPLHMELTAGLTPSLHLQHFTFRFTSTFYRMQASGTVEGNTVAFTLDTGYARTRERISLSGPPVLPVHHRAYLLQGNPQPGARVKVPFFDPFSLSPQESTAEYMGLKKTMITGRVHTLHQFVESRSGIRIKFWLNDDGRIVKEESPTGFLFLAEPEFKAKQISDAGHDLLADAAAPYSGTLPPADSDSITYRLHFPPDLVFEDLDGGRQQFEAGLLTITREQAMPGAPGGDCTPNDHLAASRYVQSDDPTILDRARNIVGTVTDPVQQVRLLAEWVHRALEKRPVIGLPDALATLAQRKGDCNEHAALFAALARSLGIPAAIATGVTLHRNAFYYHAWNEVCLDGSWLSLDTTTDQLPADLYHIRFARGDLLEQLKVGALPGRLNVEFIETR